MVSTKRKSSEMVEEEPKQKKIPVLPWMRAPINVNLIEDILLEHVPGLDPRLVEALSNINGNFTTLYPIQYAVWKQTIGPGQFERDLCINSPTGSGKTLSYALPIVQSLSTQNVRRLRALVVLPSRDLAVQVRKSVFECIAPAVGLTVGSAIGGKGKMSDEIAQLIKRPELEAGVWYDPEKELESGVDILVATPGKLMDHINTTKGFTLEHLQFLVVDEIDKLLGEEYQDFLHAVLQLTRSDEEHQFSHMRASQSLFGPLRTIRRSGNERGFKGKSSPRLVKMILSATLTQSPSKLSKLDLHHPLFLTTGRYKLPDKLQLFKLTCEVKCRPLYLAALLHELKGEQSIVFAKSKDSTHELCTMLNCFDLPFKIKEYSAFQPQSLRSKTLEKFREGKIQVLIASDAMTRGMDVAGVRNVINYAMPFHVRTYIHRAGRTARAGNSGHCFTFLARNQVVEFKKLLKEADKDSCSVHNVPEDIFEKLSSVYDSANQKYKECMQQEKFKKRRQMNFQSSRASEGSMKISQEME
ncbi:DEAD-box ATP-dependent RNA helicase 1-like [Papaver somniferum]|nr:DEAD-box ATP-dependent RNA helicase 1-like [Papaver somniferum]